MCNSLPTIPSINDIEKEIQGGILRMSKEVKEGAKQIRMINKQHHINNVAYAGEGWFIKDGSYFYNVSQKVKKYKYKIEYKSWVEGESRDHVWCFN